MGFDLDIAPAFGQQEKMLFRGEWSQQCPVSNRSLAEVAEECFEARRSFFVILAQLDNIKSSIIPMSAMRDHMDEYAFCRTFYLFSFSQKRRKFTFELTLDKGENGERQMAVMEGIDARRPIEPHRLIVCLDTLPPSIRLLNRIARYALKMYSPLISSWQSLVAKIGEYAAHIPHAPSALSSSATLLLALTDDSSPKKVRRLRVLKTKEGAAIYVFYSLIGYWRRSRSIEQKLEHYFRHGNRNPTLLYGMTYIMCEADVNAAWEIHRIYRQSSERLNVSGRVNRTLENLLLEKDLLLRLEKDPTPAEEAEFYYALSLIYQTTGRQQESSHAREQARAIALAGMRRDPKNPSFLQVYR